MGGRAQSLHEWLNRRADAPIGRLALLWYRRYFEASRNSASAATVFGFLSVGPLLLAIVAVSRAVGSRKNAFAQRLITHQHLTGETARLVREAFGTASQNALAASAVAVIGFLLWGIGIGQIYQDVYARAWRISVRRLSDQARFTIWFFVLSALLALFIVIAGSLKGNAWAAIPIWLVASTSFWLWTPYYLLHRMIGLRAFLPGALAATIMIGGATLTSPYFLGPSLSTGGKQFGSFGVVIALLAWAFILVTLSTVCAVLSPVWAEWRHTEKSVRTRHS